MAQLYNMSQPAVSRIVAQHSNTLPVHRFGRSPSWWSAICATKARFIGNRIGLPVEGDSELCREPPSAYVAPSVSLSLLSR